MANLYREIRNLLAGNPLQVGTVEAVVGSSRLIRLDDGTLARARGAYGTYPVGARVTFRSGGVVEGEAAAGDLIDIPV